MKWYAIPAKYDLWFVFVLAGLGWAVIGGLYVYFAESYLVFEEERVSDESISYSMGIGLDGTRCG